MNVWKLQDYTTWTYLLSLSVVDDADGDDGCVLQDIRVSSAPLRQSTFPFLLAH